MSAKKALFTVGGLTLLTIGIIKGKDIFQKLDAADKLTFDILQAKYKGFRQNKVNIELEFEIANHTETALKLDDLVLDVRMPNGMSAAKINEKLNKDLPGRVRSKIKMNVSIDLLKSAAGLFDVVTNYFTQPKEDRSVDSMLKDPIAIKGSLKAENFIIPIDEKIALQNEATA